MPESLKPIGEDRVSPAEGESVLLTTRQSKGWVARHARGLLRGDHPGTCVVWGGSLFEVVAAEAGSDGIEYELRPWDDAETIRTISTYDEAAEKERATRRADERSRSRTGNILSWLAVVTGHAPWAMQHTWQIEYGVNPRTLTIVSAMPLVIAGGIALIAQTASGFGGEAAGLGLPLEVRLIGTYLFFESWIRVGISMSQERGMGSLAGTFVAFVVTVARRGWIGPGGKARADERSRGLHVPDPGHAALRTVVEAQIDQALGRRENWRTRNARRSPAVPVRVNREIDLNDRYLLAEAFLSLLRPDEQLQLARRFGFKPLVWGRRTAVVILLCAVAGAFSAATAVVQEHRLSALIAFVVASVVAAGQLARLSEIARGKPSGSVFGGLVRPFARMLLEAPAHAGPPVVHQDARHEDGDQ